MLSSGRRTVNGERPPSPVHRPPFTDHRRRTTDVNALLPLVFVLSGRAGLIYESIWARYLSLLVGHSAYAQVIVLVIFLGGMAIGSFAISRWSERIHSPLLWYAAAEAAIGVFAFLFHPVFVGTTQLAYERVLPLLSPGIA